MPAPQICSRELSRRAAASFLIAIDSDLRDNSAKPGLPPGFFYVWGLPIAAVVAVRWVPFVLRYRSTNGGAAPGFALRYLRANGFVGAVRMLTAELAAWVSQS